jgi:hypothetical protein
MLPDKRKLSQTLIDLKCSECIPLLLNYKQHGSITYIKTTSRLASPSALMRATHHTHTRENLIFSTICSTCSSVFHSIVDYSTAQLSNKFLCNKDQYSTDGLKVSGCERLESVYHHNFMFNMQKVLAPNQLSLELRDRLHNS